MIPSATSYVTFPCAQKQNIGSLKVKKRQKTTYSTFKQYQFVQSVPSAWTSSALLYPLTEDTKWNAINKGFNLTLWLKLNAPGAAFQTDLRENSRMYGIQINIF